ncbi:MAG: hypothetical protein R3230_01235 [Nitrosopumilaceae archaeon]|nr:hypothetical protein [Nitrosopumilaceae archaeon]
MGRDTEILQDFDTYYDDAYAAWNAYFPMAARDLRFYLGDQWDSHEKRQLFEQGRSAFVVNRIRRVIQMVSGYQRKHRLSSVVVPVENSDQQTSDQLSQLLLYAMNYGNGYQCISDSFGGALKTGWNLINVWVDYRDDMVNGDIKFTREPYNSFIVDPYFTETDFSDAKFILKRKYLTPEHVASLLPKHEKEIYKIHTYGWERDDKFSWLPYQQMATGETLMAYNEMYQQKWKNVPYVVDMETGQSVEMDIGRNKLSYFLSQFPQLKVVKKAKRYIEKHIIVNDVVMQTEINPYDLDEYPFTSVFAFFEPESDQWDLKVQSLSRCMIDPQRESNRRRSQMTDILDSQINSGWIAKEGSVINERSLFQSSQGKVIWKKRDADPDSLEKIPPSQVPPSMFQLQEMFDRDLVEVAGVNDAAFGITENAGESGVMMMLRQGASLVNLQDLFDNLRQSQKSLSQKVLKLIQQWTPSKVERILNQEPTQQFYDKEFTKYDVNITEGILTDTQQQMYFRQLVELKNLGAPVSAEMLAQAAPIQGKTEYIQQLSQQEQAQAEAAQQQQEMQQQFLASQEERNKAESISALALSKERFSRAVANASLSDERASKAVEDRTDAALNRVKAIKELESLDDDRILKYIGIIKAMEEMSRQDEIEVKKDDVAIAAEGEQIGEQIAQPALPQLNQLPTGMESIGFEELQT